MADLETRVDDLEKKVARLEIDINKHLGDIQTSLTEIKTLLNTSSKDGDLKNQLIEKDVKRNGDRLDKLEGNQTKIVWTIILAVLGVIGEAIYYFIQNKP